MSTNKEKNASFTELQMGPTGKIVAANIARLREAYGISYNKLSNDLEDLENPIPTVGLRRIEARARRVTVDDLLALARALGVSPIRLLLGNSNQEPYASAVPDDASFIEVSAWLEGKLDDFTPSNRWRFWAQRESVLEERVRQARITKDRLFERAEQNPDDRQADRIAAASQLALDHAEAAYDEVLFNLERMKILLDETATSNE